MSCAFSAREPYIFQLPATMARRMTDPERLTEAALPAAQRARDDSDARWVTQREDAALAGDPLDYGGKLGGGGAGRVLIAPLDHDADHGLGPRGPQHHAAVAGHALLDARDGFPNRRYAARVEAPGDLHVEQHLRELAHRRGQLRERPSSLVHDREHLQCADQPVARGGLVEAKNMSGGLPSEHAARLAQQREHIAIADRRAAE